MAYWFYLLCALDMGEESVPEKILGLSQNDNPIFNIIHKVYIKSNEAVLKIDEDSFFYGLIAIISFVGIPIGIVALFVWAIILIKDELCYKIPSRTEIQTEIQNLGNKILSLEYENKVNQEFLNQEKNRNQLMIQQTNRNIQIAEQEFFALYNVLKKEFSDFLQVVDWGNIDLLIYYFITGRADDMKEALQLVDRQRQTDQIEAAIKNASIQICGTIQKAFMQLQASMAQSFSLLSEQLNLMHQQQMGQLSMLGGRLKALSQEMKEGRQNRELQEKLAQRGSLQLAEDIHQLRIYADNKAVKERNGM